LRKTQRTFRNRLNSKTFSVMELSKTELYCKKATQEEIFDLFVKISRTYIRQKKVRDKSVQRLFNTNIANKKQHDSLYAKEFNDNRMYISYLEDLKTIVKYL